jgi:RNA polymerase sigma-70 factor (ECF subfamily)
MGSIEKELILRPMDFSGPGGKPANSSEEAPALLRRAKAGDTEAFAEILVRHERLVLMTSLRILGRMDAAQDAAQEVFLRLHKYLGGFDEERELAPWLYRVVVNVCRDQKRRDRRAPASLEELLASGRATETPDPADHEAATLREEERRIVALALETLPNKESSAVFVRDVEGLSTQEVARILGSSEGTVRSQVSTGRVKIKKFVDHHLKGRR